MRFIKIRLFIPLLFLFSCEKENLLTDIASYGPGVVVENQKIPPGYETFREKFKLAKDGNDDLLPTYMKGKIVEITYPDKNEDVMLYTEYAFEYKPEEMIFKKTYLGSYLMYGVEEYLTNTPDASSGTEGNTYKKQGDNSEGQLNLNLNSIEINPKEMKFSENGKLKKVIRLKYPELVMPFFPTENGGQLANVSFELATQLTLGSPQSSVTVSSGLRKFSTPKTTNYLKTEPNSNLITSMASLQGDNSGVISEYYYSTGFGYTLLCEKRDLVSPDGVTFNTNREIYYYENVY